MNYKSEHVNELFAALCKAQGEMEIAEKSSANPFFKSKYADLTEIVRASRPALTKNGLCVTQLILNNESGESILHTILGHSSGQYIETRIKMSPAKSDVQSWASCLTYLKRYTYAAIVGITTGEEDDDGEAAVQETRRPNYQAPQQPAKVSGDQLQELQDLFDGFPDAAERFLKAYNITRLADVPSANFIATRKRIEGVIAQEKALRDKE